MSFYEFLSTPSARRATHAVQLVAEVKRISIHALREEGDCASCGTAFPTTNFYPRPPRGGRRSGCPGKRDAVQFLSTPSARRATMSRDSKIACFWDFYPRPPRGGRPKDNEAAIAAIKFLSTPSARRATDFYFGGDSYEQISIHALREEGDETWQMLSRRLWNFYPRPPRGGRPLRQRFCRRAFGFLSTPSARRATKSA